MNNREADMAILSAASDLCKCPECNGSGWVVRNIVTKQTEEMYGTGNGAEFMVPCPECNGGQAMKTIEAKKRANIPSAFYDATYKDFDWNIYIDAQGNRIDMSKWEKVVNTFVEQYETWEKNGLGLYIVSKMKGSGKTFLASCLCNELMQRYPMRTKFVSASELINIAKSGQDTGSEYERDPIKLLCECELLCLDDLGQKQTGAEWMDDILFRILDARMQSRLVTVFTSNVDPHFLKTDDRIADRINRMSVMIKLPEVCVREKEANMSKRNLFIQLGIVGTSSIPG